MNKVIDWETRDCGGCKLRLGCPHSKFNPQQIDPPDKQCFLLSWCGLYNLKEEVR